jgi:hypothetical protein
MSRSSPLTPEQRSLRARIGAYDAQARHGGHALTEKARAVSPSGEVFWENKVDPDGVLPTKERARRAQAAKKAYFTRLAFASSRARSARKGGAA